MDIFQLVLEGLEAVTLRIWGTMITPSSLKVRVRGGVVAHVILVSALGPNPSSFLFWGTFIQLGGLSGQGLGLGVEPGLDNSSSSFHLFFFKIGGGG